MIHWQCQKYMQVGRMVMVTIMSDSPMNTVSDGMTRSGSGKVAAAFPKAAPALSSLRLGMSGIVPATMTTVKSLTFPSLSTECILYICIHKEGRQSNHVIDEMGPYCIDPREDVCAQVPTKSSAGVGSNKHCNKVELQCSCMLSSQSQCP